MTKKGQAASRLDYFLVSVPLLYDVVDTTIEPSILSDHSLISLTIKISESVKKGKGLWKFNTSLLKDKKYINEIKTLVPGSTNNPPPRTLLLSSISLVNLILYPFHVDDSSL